MLSRNQRVEVFLVPFKQEGAIQQIDNSKVFWMRDPIILK